MSEVLQKKDKIKPNQVRPIRGRGKDKRYTAEPQERVDICLSCTKPAKECKGKCFGGRG